MDPNHWRNYNQAYGHLGHTGGLTPSANLNIPLISAEQSGGGLNPSLSLGTHHPVRSVGGLSGAPSAYSHPLHNPVSQFLDAVNPLQTAYSSQTPFKSSAIAQSPYSLESPVHSSDRSNVYGLSQETGNVRTHSKSAFLAEGHSTKEQAKNWNLSDYVPSQSRAFNSLSSNVTSPTNLTSPPPAHSGSLGSRISSSQRNVSTEDLFSGSSTSLGKSYSIRSAEYGGDKHAYELSSPPHQIVKNRSEFHASGLGIKDLTKSQNVTQNIYNNYVNTSSVATSESLYQSSQIQSKISSDINYDPVSPATPLSDSGQQNEDFRSVMQEFDAGIHGHGHNPVSKGQDLNIMQESHHIIKYSGMSRSGSQQNVAQEVKQQVHSSNMGSNQSLHSTHSQSPMQQSPLNMGGSPHMQMAMGSPQMPSSTMVQSTPPVQAIPDSTTKPKRGRGRKKKENPADKIKQENVSQNMNVNHDISQISSPMSNNSPQVMNIGNQQYSQHIGHSYSPQKPQPCSPHTSQAYSPQISVASMPSNAVTSPNNHIQGVGDGVIRTGHNNVAHNMNSVAVHQSTLKNSPPVHMVPVSMVPATSMSLSDNLSIASAPLLADSILGGETFTYENVQAAPTYVEQMHTNVRMGHMEKPGLDDPLGMHTLGLVEAGNIYTDLDHYNSQFDNASNSVPHSGMGFNESPIHQHGHPTSTIDEVTLSSLMGQPAPKESPGMLGESQDSWGHPGVKEEQKHIPAIEMDDEFQHLTKPPPVKKDTKVNTVNKPKVLGTPMETQCAPPKPSPIPPKTSDNQRQSSANNSFLGSFLSFIQGKKPETLSSVNSAVVKRPELPKYIPEPKRVRPPDPPENKNTPKSDSKSEASALYSSKKGGNSNSAMAFSDDEEDTGNNFNDTLKTVLLNLSDSEEKPSSNQSVNPPLKIRISVSKAMKSSKSKSKSSRNRNKSGSGKSKSRSHSFVDDDEAVEWSGEETKEPREEVPAEVDLPPSPVPLRRSSRKTTETKKKYVDSDDEDINEQNDIETPVKRPFDEELDYDSDKDPVWTPFAADNKRQPSYDAVDFDERPSRRSKSKSTKFKSFGKSKSHRRSSSEIYFSEESNDTPVKVQRMDESVKKIHKTPMNVFNNNQYSSRNVQREEESPHDHVETLPGFKVGDYILDKKDLNKFESFPIWRIEAGKMIKKYELFTENGQILHRSICTFSSWMQSMQKDFNPITVKMISWQKDKEVVQVSEGDRPKPKLDSTLETAYEEDPLADMFNVYMQIFLSQAIEPGFLGAIQEAGEEFYMGPLNNIDHIIESKQDEIEAKVKWRESFRQALRSKPHIRELDRPNLKQSCQACEHASQPAIKSIHLFGQSYDHFTLEEHPVSSTEGGSMEFLIGRTAANYVGAYHSLYHYKYNLYKRCVAKIDIVKQENPSMDNADILDKCLNNRTWVLKIFDDLKTMLDKG